ncbi:Alpha/Beta hydrolase protein [Russula ochroleuca]|uniref:Alpha/Beta hydrolase protein n=1 Tax=Russula ochroleuca TaxID=152965 RepID=A0A9P5N3M4_9AGAM|nr:Alpha/Beta hydrolase protein [Russula ochroleuca]KAF8485305.1 Alpha/Beta hydrolase protein [Russula ochroleuca]
MSNLIPSLETFAKGTAATAAGLGTLGMGLLYYGQNFLIYPSAFPAGARENVPVPSDFSVPYTDLELTTPDNVKIRAFLLLQRHVLNMNETPLEWDEQSKEEFAATRPTVLMFHGNGGNHGHRIPLGKIFFGKMRCNVLMLSYRGYGHSEGTPSEKGLQVDAQTVLDYVHAHPQLAKTPIILYGQSIGGAVAIDLAYRNPKAITALVIENTFMSLPRLIPSAMPWLGPFSFLCHQKWESYLKAPKLPPGMPVLMLGGARDEVVPRSQMQELWAIIRNRGRDAARSRGKKPPAGGGAARLEREEDEEDEDGSEKGEGEKSGSPRPGAGSGSGSDGRKVPPRIVVDGGNTYIEFADGTHNDTCVQPGYWSAVAEFVAGLRPKAFSS